MKNTYLSFKTIIALFLLAFNLTTLAQTTSPTSSSQSTASDSLITAKIKSAFIVNRDTKATSIAVETNNGVVTLSGVVESVKEATTAVFIAASTAGVKDVDASELSIRKSHKPLQDSYITAKVKGALLRERTLNAPDFPTAHIKVATRDGVVYLTGKVNNEKQKAEALQVAQSVSGVKSVKEKLRV